MSCNRKPAGKRFCSAHIRFAKRSMLVRAGIAGAALPLLVVLTGCHHRAQVAYQAPPTLERHHSTDEAWERHEQDLRRWNHEDSSSGRETARNNGSVYGPYRPYQPDTLHGEPSLVETGMASWYGTLYNHRHAADGQVYDENALTAAHRTLPLGTMVRVTNLSNGEQVVVRITDRGPFVRGRVLDLSVGAAKAIGLYRMGVARVKIEAYPPAAAPDGNWCVQTGAFQSEGSALRLKEALLQRYSTARVQEFQGPTGYWVRIDPAGHERSQAVAIQDWIGKPDAHADSFLVRLN